MHWRLTLTQVQKQVDGLAVRTWLAASLGVAARLRQSLSDRFLWLNEVAIFLNGLQRSFVPLLKLLEHNQGALLRPATLAHITSFRFEKFAAGRGSRLCRPVA
jgi:hypothetical protein